MDDTAPDEEKSKSQRKREYQAYGGLAKRLVEAPERLLARLELPDQLAEQVALGRTLKRNALKRHLKFLTAQLAAMDSSAIEAELAAADAVHQAGVAKLHDLERWRERLIGGDDELLESLAARAEGLDRQHVRQLVRNARRERDRQATPRAARALLKYLASFPDLAA